MDRTIRGNGCTMNWILTCNEAQKILKAKEGLLHVSLDLGLSTTTVQKDKINVKIDDQMGDQTIPLRAFTKVKESFCYAVEDHQLKKVALFSEETNLYYKLLPSRDWPTITLSSTPMHRHIHFSPAQDTKLKIKEIAPIKGKVLDTCCGLGYTAILDWLLLLKRKPLLLPRQKPRKKKPSNL